MIRLGIRFKTSDFLRWTNAVRRVAYSVYGQSIAHPRRCASEYADRVRFNISGGRFPIYPAYHPDYAKWKASMGLFSKGFWRLHDNLLNNLQAFKVSSGKSGQTAYMGGVPNGILVTRISMYGGRPAQKDIAMYGKKAEELRPIFEPTMEEYVRAGFWDSQLERSKRKIRDNWR